MSFIVVLIGGATVAKICMGKSLERQFFINVLAWLTFFLCWEFVFYAKLVSTTLIATPTAILWKLGFHIQKGYLQMHVIASLNRFLIGFFIAIILAVPLGVIAGTFNKLYEWWGPTLNFIRMMPPPAILPLVIIMFGIGEAPGIFVIALGAFFPIFLSALRGVHDSESIYGEVVETLGGNRLDVWLHAVIPSAMPAIFMGIRVGFGIGWLVLVSAEAIAIDRGIGFIVQGKVDIPLVFMGLTTICVIGLILDSLLKRIERIFGYGNMETMVV